jgi:hypothetical protein
MTPKVEKEIIVDNDIIRQTGIYASMPAAKYWQRRGYDLPATVRLTADPPPEEPEPIDYPEERSGFCLDAEPGYQYIDGYPQRIS